MSNIKIPEGWIFKEFVCEGEKTKFVYDDEFGDEHIYYEYKEHIPTYKELQERIDKAIEYINKNIELNNGALSNREELIVSKHDLIKSETNVLNCLIDILRGKDNE